MNKIFSLSLLLLGFFIFGTNTDRVFANPSDSQKPLEEIFPEFGYKTIESALKDFEHHYKQKLKLPLKVPPIRFTHHFGKFSNVEGEMNDHFQVVMINEELPQNHFKIDVQPIQYKIPAEKYDSNVFKLNNGYDASFIDNPEFGFNLLFFERDNWQYMFSIDSDVSDVITPEILVQIANSIDYDCINENTN